jgi:hypothetical protein
MTDPHPIVPPSEVLDEWLMDPALGNWQAIAIQAARWGANQELEACINYFYEYDRQRYSKLITGLRAARRPKPPSLKEQALEALTAIEGDFNTVGDRADTIRRALQALDD